MYFHFSHSIAFPNRHTNSMKKTKMHSMKKRKANFVHCLAAPTVSRFVMYVFIYIDFNVQVKFQNTNISITLLWRLSTISVEIEFVRSHSWFTRSQMCVCESCVWFLVQHRSLSYTVHVSNFVSFVQKFVGTFHQRQWCKRIRLFDCRRRR